MSFRRALRTFYRTLCIVIQYKRKSIIRIECSREIEQLWHCYPPIFVSKFISIFTIYRNNDFVGARFAVQVSASFFLFTKHFTISLANVYQFNSKFVSSNVLRRWKKKKKEKCNQ